MREHDPVAAARAERELAATTDIELVAGIRAAMAEVWEAAQAYRRSPVWQHAGAVGRRAYTAAEASWSALDRLGPHAVIRAAVEAVGLVLGAYWPGETGAVEAVERLRAAAMHRPTLVEQARWLTGRTADRGY